MEPKRKVETWNISHKREPNPTGNGYLLVKDESGKIIQEKTDIQTGTFLGWGIDYEGSEQSCHYTAAIIERSDGTVDLVYPGHMRFLNPSNTEEGK